MERERTEKMPVVGSRHRMLIYDECLGQGMPVVFFPGAGWPGCAGRNIGEALQPDYAFHMVDLPGFGRSDGLRPRVSERVLADWVESYMDSQRLATTHLVGHSLGAYVALVFAVHFPTRVASLTLLDMGHKRVPRLQSQPGAFGYVVPLISLTERLFGVDRLWRWLDRLDHSENETKMLEDRIDGYRHQGVYTLDDDIYLREALSYEPVLSAAGLSLLLSVYRAHPPRLLAGIRVPTLLVYSMKPTGSTAEHIKTERQVQQLIQRNAWIPTKGINGGHHVHWVEPSVATTVAEHIRASS